jgi:hypothetical protein
MDTQSKDRRGDLRPAMVAAIVAIGATAGILFNDFGPSNVSQDSGTTRMITAAAVSRAGAIEIPSEPPAGLLGAPDPTRLPSTVRIQGDPERSFTQRRSGAAKP